MGAPKHKKVKTRRGLDATQMIEPTTGKLRDVQASDVKILAKKGYKYAPFVEEVAKETEVVETETATEPPIEGSE